MRMAAAREALHLNPNSALAHNILGLGLEKKGDRQGALERIPRGLHAGPQ